MVFDLRLLGGSVTLALGGDHVQQLRAGQVLDRAQGGEQLRDVVAVDGTGVVETQFLEQRAGHEHALGVLLPALEEAAEERLLRNGALGALAPLVERAAGHRARGHLGQRADIFADRHAVVVEHDQHVWLDIAAVIECFEGHAGGHRAVADDGHELAWITLALRGDRHTQCG